MLVLARKKGQTIVIGDDVEVTVVDVQGDQIRLGVAAPRHVKVFRKEIYQEIQEENRNAAKAAGSLWKGALGETLAAAPLVAGHTQDAGAAGIERDGAGLVVSAGSRGGGGGPAGQQTPAVAVSRPSASVQRN